MNYTWLLDAGHGGVDSRGVYTTAPAKMYTFLDGFTIMEGVINRGITKFLEAILLEYNIAYRLLHDEVLDLSLTKRINTANSIHKKLANCIVLSIHSNSASAQNKGEGSNATGLEIYTSRGKDKSDIVAEPLGKLYQEDFPEFRFRSDKTDGDLDKEAGFAMVGGNKKIPLNCPSVLVENLFFDNRKEAELLITEEFQQRIAGTLGRWIYLIEQTKPI